MSLMACTYIYSLYVIGLLVCILILSQAPSSTAGKCTFPAIFNFGDSTSDTGGIHVSFPFRTLAEQLPYGETFFHRPVNRYSDGRLLIDFIAQGLGKEFLSPYLQSVDSNFTQGANFASSGATAKSTFFISPFSLNIQVNQFKVFKQQVSMVLEKKGRRDYLPRMNAFKDGLYIIQIGGNDFSYAYMKLKMSAEQIKGYLPGVVNAISNAVKELYEEGAATIWVLDVGPQGCMPFVLTKYPYLETDLDEHGCARPFNEAVLFYNRLLKAQLVRLQEQLPGSKVIYVDTYDIQYSMIQDAQRYGFEYTTRACCGVGGKHNYDYDVQCGSNNRVHGQFLSALSCVDPSMYVNWDGVHLTDRANQVLARHILSGTYFHPFFPLTAMCPSHLNMV